MDHSRQLLVAPTAAAQASLQFLADDRPEEMAAKLLASLLTRTTEDLMVHLTRGRRVWAVRLVAELLLRLTEVRRAAVKRPG